MRKRDALQHALTEEVDFVVLVGQKYAKTLAWSSSVLLLRRRDGQRIHTDRLVENVLSVKFDANFMLNVHLCSMTSLSHVCVCVRVCVRVDMGASVMHAYLQLF
jgi:hypothetical protein